MAGRRRRGGGQGRRATSTGAGALVLLYGISVTRVAELTQHHIDRRDDGAYLKLGQRPVLMPPAIARLVAAQADTARPQSAAARSDFGQHPWLFPGRLAGRPIDSTVLSQRLATHGIAVRPARNTAVLALAGDLPAPVLSQILGVHINTAVDWAKHAKRDWAAYLHARAATHSPSELAASSTEE